ncbi:hypothetical protein Dimus_005735, partial [Dionaea muscipula]
GEDEELPEENATQESQAVAAKTKPKSKPQKKTMASLAIGKNEIEAAEEDTQTDEATDEDA